MNLGVLQACIRAWRTHCAQQQHKSALIFIWFATMSCSRKGYGYFFLVGRMLTQTAKSVSSRPSYMPVAHLDTQITRIHILDI